MSYKAYIGRCHSTVSYKTVMAKNHETKEVILLPQL